MKPIAAGLFFLLLFMSGFAYAAANQCDQSSVIVCQPDGVICQHAPAFITTTYLTIFAGPEVGWLNLPVDMQTRHCCPSRQ